MRARVLMCVCVYYSLVELMSSSPHHGFLDPFNEIEQKSHLIRIKGTERWGTMWSFPGRMPSDHVGWVQVSGPSEGLGLGCGTPLGTSPTDPLTGQLALQPLCLACSLDDSNTFFFLMFVELNLPHPEPLPNPFP